MSIKVYLNQQQLTEYANLGRVLGNAHRVNIVQYLSQQECSVDSLAQLLTLSIANTSQHLQQLKRSGIVESRRSGKLIYYRLTARPIMNILAAFKLQVDFVKQDVNRDGVSDNKDFILSHDKLISGLNNQKIRLIDVRSSDEFNKGHIPSAVSIPFELLENNLALLPGNKKIVIYCRGFDCLLSRNAVISLRAKGFQAYRFQDGMSAIHLFKK